MNHQRWKAQIAVAFLARHQTSVLLTESVSLRSVFVRTDAPPPSMALLRVQLLLPPDDSRLLIDGMVATTVQPRSAHAVAGVEVEFFRQSDEANACWDRFIRHLRKTHPEAIDRPVMLARDVVEPLERYAFVDDFRDVDISPRGMFIVTSQRFAVGADVRVTLLDSASAEKRTIDCVVRRRAAGRNHGIGVEYRNMTGETWTDLVAFLGRASRSLRTDLQVVRAPYQPMAMQTLPGL